MRTRPSTASNRPERSTLRGWNTTSPSDRMTVGPKAARCSIDVERAREEPVGERIVDQERRDGEQVRVARVLDAVALQRAEVVGVAELGAQRFEDRPVALLALGADLAREVALQVGGDAVVVEQRVVDVEQEHDAAADHWL